MLTLGQSVYQTLLVLTHNFLSANLPYATLRDINNLPPAPDIRDTIAQHGYPVEEHEVQTADGYLLTLFRIPHGRNGAEKEAPPRLPVLLTHGFLSSAADWLTMGPNASIGYRLADAGYDVWLGNCRGNRWSRKHVKHHPDEPRFWKFSFHEIGYYDLPANLDLITAKTGHDKVFYVGHSQGTTSMLVMASERPEYIKKVRLFVALAPVAFTRDMPNAMAQFAATFYKQLEEFFPFAELLRRVLHMLCQNGTPYQRLCLMVIHVNMGYSEDAGQDYLSMALNGFPAGSSTRQVLHFVQNKISDSFRKYDHGIANNMRIYGQSQPPKYNLRTTLPTALIYSDNDWLSTVSDVERIGAELKNLKAMYKLPILSNHLDYLLGNQTLRILWEELTRLFDAN